MDGALDIVNGWFEFFFSFLFSQVENATQVMQNGIPGKVNDILSSTQALLSDLAIDICVICFCIEMIKTCLNSQQFNLYEVIKVLFKYSFSRACISIGTGALSAIYGKAGDLMSELVSQNLDYSQSLSELTALGEGGIWSFIMLLPLLLISIVIVMISVIAIIIIAYGRQFEVYILFALAPVPLAFIPLSSTSDVTKKFFLDFAAVCFQGVVIILVVQIWAAMVGPDSIIAMDNSQPITNLISYLCQMLMLVIMVIKSQTISKHIFGLI